MEFLIMLLSSLPNKYAKTIVACPKLGKLSKIKETGIKKLWWAFDEKYIVAIIKWP